MRLGIVMTVRIATVALRASVTSSGRVAWRNANRQLVEMEKSLKTRRMCLYHLPTRSIEVRQQIAAGDISPREIASRIPCVPAGARVRHC